MPKSNRFLLITLFSLLICWSSAQNQNATLPDFPIPTLVVGGQINFLGFIFGTGLHLGAEDLFIENLGARFDAEVLIPNKDNRVNLGLSVLYTVFEEDTLSGYAGGGLRALRADAYSSFGVGLLGGIEYHFAPLSWFAEAEYSTTYSAFRTGLNFRFQLPENP